MTEKQVHYMPTKATLDRNCPPIHHGTIVMGPITHFYIVRLPLLLFFVQYLIVALEQLREKVPPAKSIALAVSIAISVSISSEEFSTSC